MLCRGSMPAAAQMIVTTILASMPMLADIFVLTLFYLAIFGAMCVQLYGGQFRYR